MIAEHRALAAAADKRFPSLEGHGERTASYAVAAAHAMGVSERRLAALRIAGALHYAWSEAGECPCREPAGVALSRWELSSAPQAADFVRGMRADWNMAPLESSILLAACRFDLRRYGFSIEDAIYRAGVAEALASVAPLITPLDRADV